MSLEKFKSTAEGRIIQKKRIMIEENENGLLNNVGRTRFIKEYL